MTHHFNPPPQSVCLLRLSAIGDTCHALAALRALQAAWPDTRFTWIIGKLEARLMSVLVPEVEFITFDKSAMFGELQRLGALLAGRRFDLLLNLQLSFRASLVSTRIRAPIKLGFDRRRARELQWLFTNSQIAPARNEHVLDSFLGFVRACGVEPGPPTWRVVPPPAALAYAERLVPDGRRTLVISPCSSHPLRNWPAARYASIARHAIQAHGMQVVLAGGRSRAETEMGAAIVAAVGAAGANASEGATGSESAAQPADLRLPGGQPAAALLNQIGRDTLPELLALLSRSTVLLSPDSGPVHMATMVGLPVIGLYATARSARVGPYYSRAWCIDEYDAAARKFLGKTADELPWTTKIEQPGVMELIEVEAVRAKLDTFALRWRDE